MKGKDMGDTIPQLALSSLIQHSLGPVSTPPLTSSPHSLPTLSIYSSNSFLFGHITLPFTSHQGLPHISSHV